MDWQGWFSLGLALAALLLMSSGRFAPHMVMMAALVVLSASGIISADQALAGFSNSGLITVVAMLVVAAGIHPSGGVDLLVNHLLRSPKSVRSAQARIALPVALLSGFLNNTPVVATMIPAVHAWSRKIGIAPSKLMIPLSYSAILGGTLTLIGTSTNLVALPAFVSRQRYNKDFLLINDLETETPRHDRAWLSWGILLVLVGLAACSVLSMLNAALLGAAMMILTGCCTVGQAQKSVDVPVILAIAASFALGAALE